IRVVPEHDVQHGDQHEHQGEDAHEGEPGDQHGQVAGLVVAELLPYRDGEGQPGMPLLELVHSLEDLLELVHRDEDVPGPSGIHPLRAGWCYRRPSPPCRACATDMCYKLSPTSSGCRQPCGADGAELAAGEDPDGVAGADGPGASCVQAAMTTRLPDVPALPPRPPRSTK